MEEGQPVGDFTTSDIYGNRVTLSDYMGKVVMLDFWATWCPPCAEEAPELKKAYQKYHDEGFEIISVSLDRDLNDLRAFLDEHDIEWTQIYTGQGWNTPIAVRYSVSSLPAPWLIGKDGTLITKEARGDHLEPLVEKALQTELPPESR